MKKNWKEVEIALIVKVEQPKSLKRVIGDLKSLYIRVTNVNSVYNVGFSVQIHQ